jgi:hypothetical protein
MKTFLSFRRLWCVMLTALALVQPARAQWQTQTMTLKPGWNAVYLHVDASHILLDDLITGAGNPIAEVWQWQPPLSTVQYVVSPASPTLPNSQWAVWNRSLAVSDTLASLVGNAAYLVRNTNAADFTWNVTGKPVPPRYQWATSGLNFIGFPTPTNAPPNFDNFLAPVPAFKAQFLPNSVDAGIYQYPGGELGTTNPVRVLSQLLRNVTVKRGEAFWMNAGQGVYNHYFGPFEVVLQNPAGIDFADSLSTYSLRLKNTSESNRTVTVTMALRSSGPWPAGQTPIVTNPPVVMRGPFNPTNLTYHVVPLSTPQTFDLAAQGADGSEVEVVLGLERAAMTAEVGSLYAGVIRIADTAGLEQVDLPVRATVGDTSGLWIGEAQVTSVNHYLKSYANTNNPSTIPTTDASGYSLASLPGATWLLRTNSTVLNWRSVASSADGTKLIAAVNSGQVFVSTNSGQTWTQTTAGSRQWTAVASSADGTRLVGVVNNGQVYISTNAGLNWTQMTTTARPWTAVASSADGSKLVAVANNTNILTSTDFGTNWIFRTSAPAVQWRAVASSADGDKLVAAALGTNIYTSIDAGTNWTARSSAGTNLWRALASSADGNRLVAAATGTNLYTSLDSGSNWTLQIFSPTNAWTSVAASADGMRLMAGVTNGPVYTSADGGTNWLAHDTNRAWSAVATSADGGKLVAVVNGGQIYTSTGTFVQIEFDASGRVMARTAAGAPYIATATNLTAGAVARAYPLRLIVHQSGVGNEINLLQRVYFGLRQGTNLVVATRESLLDSATLASARRISVAHLPFSHTNKFWQKTSGALLLGSNLVFNVNLDYKDQAANPFLHTYHPDHDNLKSDFRTVEVQGAESYTVNRTITLAFTPPGSDFAGVTSAAGALGGTYAEVITFFGRSGNTREFKIGGSFTLNRISPLATLTTQ